MQKSLSLSAFCADIKYVLEEGFAASYWVRAEISSLSVRGHCYMELVEKSEGTELLAAKVRATCWQNVWNMLSAYFFEQTGQSLRAGMKVLLQVEVNFHSVYGLSLNIVNIDPAYTVGELLEQRQQTISRLQQDGVWGMQKLLSLPTLIRNIAVISSADAAGYEDFCNQLKQSPYRFHICLFNALVQGDRAPQSIINALIQVAEAEQPFDVVVIIRGGGATTDLSCFDNYELSSVCAQFPLPILTGIGHQRDTSIVDMVAFESLKTPTAVAAMIVGKMLEQQRLIESYHKQLLQTAQNMIRKQQYLLQSRLQKLQTIFSFYLQQQRSFLQQAEHTLRILSPEIIYKKGYTRTTLNGKAITDLSLLHKGDVLTTEFLDGKVQSEVI